MTDIQRIAVTRENIEAEAPEIIRALSTIPLIGLDIETADPRRHAGLAAYDGKAKKLVFDINRTDLCGLSLWPDNYPKAWYFNIGHADTDTQILWPTLQRILDAKPPTSKWIIHNAPFERTMLNKTVGWDIQDYICTLLMAVSAYSPDEYNINEFAQRDLGGIAALIPDIITACRTMQETPDVLDLLSKVIAKTSDAGHSYNGYVKEMAYGYGLKKAVKSWFGYDMTTFEQCLGKRAHMGELTSIETAPYGCDDAIWCVKLYHRLLAFMMETNPAVVGTYFRQELPMVEAYSETWRTGVKINGAAVDQKEQDLRAEYATNTRALKALIRQMLPFPAELNPGLVAHEDWYVKNGKKYRGKLEAWANSPDDADDFTQAVQLSGAIPNAWATELGKTVAKDRLNLTHYMPMRVIMYDLFRREKPLVVKGKVQSDAWARGRLKEALTGPAAETMTLVGAMGTIEQSSKLFLTPYRALLDPNTSTVYPVLGSELATRRMAMSTPNAMQLAKRGESVYVRGFYQPDYEDHVIVSLDWSQIELVLVGEFSGDPFFAQCYNRLPYDDLHIIACSDTLEVTPEEFLALKNTERFLDTYGADHKLLLNPKGEKMAPDKAFKWWRTEVGKGSNFSYWYSGALSQVGERLGWTTEEMWAATERYRQKFAVAEQWRIEQIQFAQEYGYTLLPDGHRRTRFEATPNWARMFRAKWQRWDDPGVQWFADMVIRKTQTRANNQGINALIQGSCATLAKRSSESIRAEGWSTRDARFMFPVHDELVYSVHRDLVVPFIHLARSKMLNHPDIIKNLKMDCSPSVGLTFQPWDARKAPTGQMELYEAPELDFIPKEFHGGHLPEELWPTLVNHLFEERARG